VPTVGELEARIDEALVIARVSEEGVREVGEMAIDAAKQARRAAEMAEKSAHAAVAAAGEAATVKAVVQAGSSADVSGPAGPVAAREVVIDPVERFYRRADALAARLEKLQRV
jgi:hypothetical protein